MDTVTHQRTLNTLLGSIMLICGLLFFAAAAYIYKHPPAPQGSALLVNADSATCERTLAMLKFSARRQGNDLFASVYTNDFNESKQLLSNASIAISACGMPLLRFCLGPGCHVPGTSFVLSTKVAATVSRP